MALFSNQLSEFDLFMDEDTRARRIGILCLEKTLTPALTQALFRIKEKADNFHQQRISSLKISQEEKREKMSSSHK